MESKYKYILSLRGLETVKTVSGKKQNKQMITKNRTMTSRGAQRRNTAETRTSYQIEITKHLNANRANAADHSGYKIVWCAHHLIFVREKQSTVRHDGSPELVNGEIDAIENTVYQHVILFIFRA